MTTQDKLRGLILAALMVTSVFAGTIALSGTVAADRGAGNVETLPETVFVGEGDLDFTPVGDISDNQGIVFYGTSGDADGDIITVSDPSTVDTGEFSTGAYDIQTAGASGDDASGTVGGSTDISVQEGEMSGVTIYQGLNTDGAEVQNGRIGDTDYLTIEPDYNFEVADKVSVTVEDEEGFNITDRALTENSEEVDAADQTNNILLPDNTDDEFVKIDVEDLPPGTYDVTAEGDDIGASQTVTFTIGEDDANLEFDSSSIIKGENAVLNVSGNPGATPWIRIDSDDLDTEVIQEGEDSNENAILDSVFENGFSDADYDSQSEYIYAQVDLGDDGEDRVRLGSADFEADSTLTVEAVTPDATNPTEEEQMAAIRGEDTLAEADLEVAEQTITLDNVDSPIAVNEDFMMNGSAPEIDSVTPYAKVGTEWHQITVDDDTVDIDEDGEFNLEATADGELAIAGSYRIGVAPGSPEENAEIIDSDAWGDTVTPTASTSIQTVAGNLSASLSRTDIAAVSDDSVTLSGGAFGQSKAVVYTVGPRGDVEQESLDIEGNEFSQELDGFNRRGTHNLIVVGTGGDSRYVPVQQGDGGWDPSTIVTTINEDSMTQEDAVAIILDKHDATGYNDDIARANLTARSPSITVEDVSEVTPSPTVFNGTSNREPGTVLFAEMTDDDGNSVVSGQIEVSDEGTWSFNANLQDVETGNYTFAIEGDETSASTQVSVVEEISTPTPTPEPTPTATPSPTPEPTPTPTPTPEPTPTPTPEPTPTATATPTDAPSDGDDGGDTTPSPTTTGDGPGFGVVVSLIALLAAALIATRRRD
ncbi:PGF-CTERM sorting domain-containing protein [Halosimplex pelagicum]|uniref:PGF-CTERM sorting domain-containing protein n=1 Tax=Halosimplex pelagicum TaxID=869886 RepID=A0A7D5PH73_9EURY|nr:PGF-CTERM sorting domain-containing protein [Halosimplex pelagicum]QLH84919.1 PGF-CTERM sorting domain-containing protein [Halosimplex pelagicum]